MLKKRYAMNTRRTAHGGGAGSLQSASVDTRGLRTAVIIDSTAQPADKPVGVIVTYNNYSAVQGGVSVSLQVLWNRRLTPGPLH